MSLEDPTKKAQAEQAKAQEATQAQEKEKEGAKATDTKGTETKGEQKREANADRLRGEGPKSENASTPRESYAIRDEVWKQDAKDKLGEVNQKLDELKARQEELGKDKINLANERKDITERSKQNPAEKHPSERHDPLEDQARLGDIHNRELEINYEMKANEAQIAKLEERKAGLEDWHKQLEQKQNFRAEWERQQRGEKD